MLTIETNCPFCHTDEIGFQLCADGETIVLLCDQCDVVWCDPREVDAEHALYLLPDWSVPGIGQHVWVSPARWANVMEVAGKGWSAFVAGSGEI